MPRTGRKGRSGLTLSYAQNGRREEEVYTLFYVHLWEKQGITRRRVSPILLSGMSQRCASYPPSLGESPMKAGLTVRVNVVNSVQFHHFLSVLSRIILFPPACFDAVYPKGWRNPGANYSRKCITAGMSRK